MQILFCRIHKIKNFLEHSQKAFLPYIYNIITTLINNITKAYNKFTKRVYTFILLSTLIFCQLLFEMGNTQPTNSNLQVYIETEKGFYNSGSIIQGVVFVNALKNFPIDALYLRIQGDQYCQWFQGSSKNRRKYTGNQNFYAVEHMLCKYNKMLQQGKYAYPFSLELSENIPGSFQSTQYDARVDYKLIAYFANFETKKKRFYYSVPLMIRQPFRQEHCEYQGKVTEEPNKCFCMKQGQIYLYAKFKRNVCFEGQNVELQIECDNSKGKSNIKRFRVDLVQYTFVSANNGVSRTYKKLIKKQFLNHIVQKGTSGEKMKHVFTVEKISHPTAISTLVANYYRLEVYPDMGLMVKDQPSIYSPLFVMKNQYKIKEQAKKVKQINSNEYKAAGKVQMFKAPEYWFRKNKNLSVMNFRLEDGIAPSQSEPMLRS